MSILTKQALRALNQGATKDNFKPQLQILDIKLLGTTRYRVVISDGEDFSQAMIGGTCQDLFKNNLVSQYQIVTLKGYSITLVSGSPILIISELDLGVTLDSTVGEPNRYELDYKQQTEPPVRPKFNRPVEEAKSNKPKFEETKQIPYKMQREQYMPIKALTTLNDDWIIKARVTQKGAIKSWNNDRGNGKLFNINLIDGYNDEIQATFFKEAADK